MFKFGSLTRYLVRGLPRVQAARMIASTAGPAQLAQDLSISSFELQHDKNLMSVKWNDGTSSRYPFFHLRDNCQCSECWHSDSLQRQFDTYGNLELNVRPQNIHVVSGGNRLVVTWPDDHVSEFDAGVLFEKRLPETAEEAREAPPLTSRRLKLWGKSLEENIPRISFDDILHHDEALFSWLSSLSMLGFALVVGSPSEVGQVERLAERVAFLRTTLYGKTYLTSIRAEANDLAYTPSDLPSHNDLVYMNAQPAFQIFHCVQQTTSTGGASTLVDGFNAAYQLRERDAEAFRLLSNTPIYYEASGKDLYGDYLLGSIRPAISVDYAGKVCAIAVSEAKRARFVGVTVDKSEEIFAAYQKFVRLLRDPSNLLEYKMEEGDMITIENQRVLHGRRAFRPSVGDTRTLVGAYLGWDEVNSRLHVLSRRFNKPIHDEVLGQID